MSTLIHVTADDIDGGVVGSCGRCPVALALHRTIGCLTCDIAVSPFTAHIYLPWGALDLPLPSDVTEFISSFDNGERPEPFSFRLRLPE